jgi:hypothetical protein
MNKPILRREGTNLSEEQIDQIVVGQADDDSAWNEPIHVERSTPASLSIPADLAARAAFLAQVHRSESLVEWLTHVVRVRVELVEAAFAGASKTWSQKVARP